MPRAPRRKASAGVGEVVKKAKGRRAVKDTVQTINPPPLPSPSADMITQITDEVTQRVTQNVAAELTSKMDAKLDSIMAAIQTGVKGCFTPADPESDPTNEGRELTGDVVADAIGHTTQNIVNSNGENPVSTIDLSPGPIPTGGGVLTQVSQTDSNSGENLGFNSVALSITGEITTKIKTQIWAGQYVDFSLLLAPISETKYKLRMQNDKESPELCWVPTEKTSTLSRVQWVQAWNRFSAVICQKSPQLGSNLPHHMETVMELCDRRGDWRFYDQQFRRLIAEGTVKWGSVHLELYLKSLMGALATSQEGLSGKKFQSNGGARPSTYLPQGACFSYHRTGRCSAGSACTYQHACIKCSGQHPFIRCRQQNANRPFQIKPRFKQAISQTNAQGPFRANANTGYTRNNSDGQQQSVVPQRPGSVAGVASSSNTVKPQGPIRHKPITITN